MANPITGASEGQAPSLAGLAESTSQGRMKAAAPQQIVPAMEQGRSMDAALQTEGYRQRMAAIQAAQEMLTQAKRDVLMSTGEYQNLAQLSRLMSLRG